MYVRLAGAERGIGEVRSDKGVKEEVIDRNPNGLVSTTVGRIIFNDILEPEMAYYDLSLSSKRLQRIIADCYELLGRRHTIDLLDRMKEVGFRESTRSGLSFATDDLRTPGNKEQVLNATEPDDAEYRPAYDSGNLPE